MRDVWPVSPPGRVLGRRWAGPLVERPRLRTIGVLLVAVFWVLGSARAEDAAPRYELLKVKAAFVFSFARYIEWPPERLVPPEAPFVIGLTVNSSLLAELEAIVRTRSLQGRRVLVRQVRTGEEARQTHLLFIDPKDEKLLLDELGDLLTSGVVTVGESSRFDEAGGMLMLYIEGDRLRFQINAQAIRAAPVKLSSQLLKLAAPIKKGT